MERIKGDRPELYDRLKKTGIDENLDDMKMDLFQAMGTKEVA
jgi:hypothetical protein